MMDRDKADAIAIAISQSIVKLVKAEIAAQKDEEPDSMGSYYEEQELRETISQILVQE